MGFCGEESKLRKSEVLLVRCYGQLGLVEGILEALELMMRCWIEGDPGGA